MDKDEIDFAVAPEYQHHYDVRKDAINPVRPELWLLGGFGGKTAHTAGKMGARAIERKTRRLDWRFGDKKTPKKWENQMKKRGWTEQQISETIEKGEWRRAPNKVKRGDRASRFIYKDGYVVRNEKTGEIMHLKDKNDLRFKPNKFRGFIK